MTERSVVRFYSGKRVLVTGGLGFLGTNLLRALQGGNARVSVFGRSWPPQARAIDAIIEGVIVLKSDIRDSVAVQEAVEDCDVIFHLAGKSGPTASNASPLEDLDVNSRGTLTLLEACRHVNPTVKIVFPSSRLVYSAQAELPVNEAAATAPLSIYGIHKLAAERYLLLYQRLYGIRACILRISNPYGPFQRPEQNRYGIVNWFIQEAAHDRPLTIYGDGAQLRDYIHIDDVVGAMLAAGGAEEADGRTFNVGTGRGVSFLEMAELIIRKTGRSTVKHIDWPADAALVESGDFVADTSLVGKHLGWKALVPLESGVEDVIAKYAKFQSI